MSDSTVTITKPRTRTATRPKPKFRPAPMWNVVLHDDSSHSYQYVMEMMQILFRKGLEDSFLMARKVDTEGRVICETSHKERAEFKRDQILGYGADPYIVLCKGSMSASIEPATDPDDED